MVLLVFAGSAAEFALNRAVDWLFFTGKVPGDPLGRLFATARYAQQIVFADELDASSTLDRIRAIHSAVERQRGLRIPEWAHRDVLYMLIDYSERAYELLHRPLSPNEQNELYDVFYRVGMGLGISHLRPSYMEWRADRDLHLTADLLFTEGTERLFAQYRRHLGPWRYRLLLRVQAILAPRYVRSLLQFKSATWLRGVMRFYPMLVRIGLQSMIRRLLLPPSYLPTVRGLDHMPPITGGARDGPVSYPTPFLNDRMCCERSEHSTSFLRSGSQGFNPARTLDPSRTLPSDARPDRRSSIRT